VMAWGYNSKGAHEIPDNEVRAGYPNREEAAHLPTSGFASHTYNHDNTYHAHADENRLDYRRN
jgi:hypothetical protein